MTHFRVFYWFARKNYDIRIHQRNSAPQVESCTEIYKRYDALGRRYHKRSVRPTPDGPSQTLKTTWYGWDGDRLVTTQTNTQTDELTDERTSSTLYEPNSFVPMIRIDKTSQKTRKADGTQEAQNHQSKAFYHCNHLGTPLALIDVETAKIIWQAEFDPWGLVKSQYNPHHMDQPIRMQGQQRDQETGLFYNRYRYYVPQVGRYVTQDPVGLLGGNNMFSYAQQDPINYIDPLGLDRWGHESMRVYTDRAANNTSVFDPSKGKVLEIETRTASVGKPGADGPYDGEFTYCERVAKDADNGAGGGYGPLKWRTTDRRSRWIHGGGTGLPDAYDAPRQGWKPTLGCTRAQNEDVRILCEVTEQYKKDNPGKRIFYHRK
ncbi:RHS domain-containing protein [Curvibacter sp. RS43]|uniref:RHS repeat-associated core domain-containing protein n=1 Tax=Curvibacter microcysteis TaxID=3026419 RepID=UPI002360689C|nr:RHS repeat-associated core domain-containing protein [Curvibacter sp. RS43]MDD0808737.1 RHS domain-containing protein [Curvibacter sp. RS43]